MIERAIVSILFNALWEPLVLALAAWAVLSAARTANAATRCAVLTAALVASIALPILSGIASVRPDASTTPVRQTAMHAVRIHPHAIRAAMPAPPVSASHERFIRPTLTLPRSFTTAILIGWALAAFAFLLRLAISFIHLEGLKRDALPLSTQARTGMRRWAEKAGGDELRLCVSDKTLVPIAVGWFDAMVLIPRRLVDELDAPDLDRIVLHEIAHLRRRDSIVHMLQQIGNALFFFSPGMLWIGRQLDVEREVACDDWVVERNEEAGPYATCLLRLAERTPWPHSALPAPGAFVTRKSMSIRIERILRRARSARLHPAPLPVAVSVIAVAAIAAVGLSLSPTLADSVTAAHRIAPRTVAARSNTAQNRPVQHPSAQHHAPQHRAAQHTAAPLPTPTLPREAAAVAVVAPTVVAPTTVVAKATPAPRRTQPPRAVPTAATFTPYSGDDYITDMESVLGTLNANQLIELKSVGVTPDYVRAIRQAGYGALTARQIVAARANGLTPQNLAALRASFGALSFEEAIAVSAIHLDAAYRASMQAAGLQDLSLSNLITLKSLDVTSDYIKQADALGFGTLTARQIVELKSMDIDAAYLARVRQHFPNVTYNQLIELKASGVIK